MRAIVIHEHGGPDAMKLEEHPDPTPGAGQVVVDLEAAALNRLDMTLRKGLPTIRLAMPHILGCEGAGIVTAVGEGVSHVKPGDRVVVTPGSSCGSCEACAVGDDASCRGYRMLGYQDPGCYAEKVLAPASSVFPAGDALSTEEWAALPLVYLTAWRMLMTRAELKPGETVLIQAAGSGVGMAGIQIARLAGARVIATAGTNAKLEMAGRLGAADGINYATADVGKEVRRITGGKGVDVVFEHVGAATWDGSLMSLGRNGRLVICGVTSGHDVSLDLRYLFTKQHKLMGSYMGGRRDLLQVLKLAGRGDLKPLIDRTFPLAEAAAAHNHLDSRAQFGKVVLRI